MQKLSAVAVLINHEQLFMIREKENVLDTKRLVLLGPFDSTTLQFVSLISTVENFR